MTHSQQTSTSQTPSPRTEGPLTDFQFRVSATVEASAVVTVAGHTREDAETRLRAQFQERHSDVNQALGEDASEFFRKHAQPDDYQVTDAADD